MDTVRGWVRNGLIQPPPVKDGREYLVDEFAVKVNSINETGSPNLLQRIGHAAREKSKKSGFTT
ncbi:excisionase [Arsenophonus sp. aPb]|uniref:excisionase n=1 Tax=Arsenophonus sp. aPb TaxID=3041619 RepID=UPI0024685390|nr:excisionase [Arsenophonus sp. aPb]WGL99109.1 excisionase [Arsenophonus sp. aPb]